MTRYLLDTSILIDYSKNREPARSRLTAMLAAGFDLCTCAVVVGEFYTGLPPGERPTWDAFLGAFSYLPMPWDTGVTAGADRYAYARLGQPLGIADALIAATARSAGAVVVTANPRDFPMVDVPIISLGS